MTQIYIILKQLMFNTVFTFDPSSYNLPYSCIVIFNSLTKLGLFMQISGEHYISIHKYISKKYIFIGLPLNLCLRQKVCHEHCQNIETYLHVNNTCSDML